MDFQKLIDERQSVRRYSNKKVKRKTIEKLMEAVQVSPSACNSQPWRFIFVDDPQLKDNVARATFTKSVAFNKFTTEAPVMVVVVIEKAKLIAQLGSHIKKLDYPLIDIGIAAEHLCLKATELGLGTCMIGWFDEKKIKNLLQIPRKRKIGLLISLGYPADGYKDRKKIRKSLEEIYGFNGYK